jgi:hypothetical protein
VYWVHLILVYGPLTAMFQKSLSIPATALAAVATIALMVGLAALWQRWRGRKAGIKIGFTAVSSISA